jgi:hypothetical protein
MPFHEFNDINLNDCWLGAMSPISTGTGLRQRIEKRLARIPPLASRRRPQAPTLCPRASDCGKPLCGMRRSKLSLPVYQSTKETSRGADRSITWARLEKWLLQASLGSASATVTSGEQSGNITWALSSILFPVTNSLNATLFCRIRHAA